jgi:AmmeMemoRadiSam system protein B
MSEARSPVVAGYFYPANPRQLEQECKRYLSQVEPIDHQGEVVGLICPHAGYSYSGQTAAYSYSLVCGNRFDLVVVISPAHRMLPGRFSITRTNAYQTPLGRVKLDLEAVDALGQEIDIRRVGIDQEHAIEVQLPFLQVTLEDILLLPVMVSETSVRAGAELGLALSQAIAGKKVLLIASTDMHHISDYESVIRHDKPVIDAIASLDMARIEKILSRKDSSVCGRVPVFAMLTAATALGAHRVEILHYTTSGDVTGARAPGQYTVGYLSAAVLR